MKAVAATTTSAAGIVGHSSLTPEEIEKYFAMKKGVASSPSVTPTGATFAASPKMADKAEKGQQFDYDGFCQEEIDRKKSDKSYRYFNNINRLAQSFPKAATGSGSEVTVWCSNDYLGMSRHPVVIKSIK